MPKVSEQVDVPKDEKKVVTPTDFKLEQLFGSKTRVRLLGLFLETPGRSYYVRELTRRIGAQLNSVRRELGNLVELGIVSEVEGKILPGEKETKKKSDKKKFYKANEHFSFFEELRGIMKKSAVLMNQEFVQELKTGGDIALLFLTGRFVDDHDVPSDVLVVGKITTKKLETAIANFEKHIGREINYTYMPRDEYQYRREVKDRFLQSLLGADKVVLINTIEEEL